MRTATVDSRETPVPERTPEPLEEPRRVAARPDEESHTSDAPDLSEAQEAQALRGRFGRPVKRKVTARLGANVPARPKAGGPRYQTRMNGHLRRAVLAALRGKG